MDPICHVEHEEDDGDDAFGFFRSSLRPDHREMLPSYEVDSQLQEGDSIALGVEAFACQSGRAAVDDGRAFEGCGLFFPRIAFMWRAPNMGKYQESSIC